mgnify:CR=1 FL=1
MPAVRARSHSLRAIVLRTSRFFPEEDDNRAVREAYTDANVKTNEFLYRRVDIEDVVSAHLLAARSRAIGPVSRNTSSAPPRHSRATTWRNCATTRRLWSAVTCRIMWPNLHGAAGR